MQRHYKPFKEARFFWLTTIALSAVLLTSLVFGRSNAQTADYPKPATKSEPKIYSEEKIIELAKSDHIALLKLAIDNYRENIADYTGTLYKQERIAGKLGEEQVISFKFKENPFSLYMEWKKNAGPADRLLYVEGCYDNQMIVHPTGLLSWVKSVKRDPRCKAALRSSLYPCDFFGFNRMMTNSVQVYEQAQKNGDLETKYLGPTLIDGRRCIMLERVLPEKKEYDIGRLIVQVDVEYLLPVAVTSFDWQDNLISRYVYVDLKFNTALSDKQFTPEANKL